MKHSYATKIAIGAQEIALAITYAYVAGAPAQGPSYSSGGQPAETPEVDILTLEWAAIPDGKPFVWHKIDGPLFDLIAADEELYYEICDAYTGEPAS